MATEQLDGKTITLQANTDLSAAQYRFMTTTSGRVTTQTSAGGQAVGILQNKPSAQYQAAEIAPCCSGMVSKIVLGATVSAGINVQSDTTGRATEAASSDHVLGYLLVGGDANEIGEVLLMSNHVLA